MSYFITIILLLYIADKATEAMESVYQSLPMDNRSVTSPLIMLYTWLATYTHLYLHILSFTDCNLHMCSCCVQCFWCHLNLYE